MPRARAVICRNAACVIGWFDYVFILKRGGGVNRNGAPDSIAANYCLNTASLVASPRKKTPSVRSIQVAAF